MKTLILILVFASTTQAQTLPRIALWGGTAADIASTRYGLSQGLREGNPLIGDSAARHVGISVGTAALIDYYATQKVGKHGKTLLWISAGIRMAVAGWNVVQVKKSGLR